MQPTQSSTSKRKRCVIGGFMGTGKTSVGRLLSARMEIPFLDMDEKLAVQWGEIHLQFARDGERAFRLRERELALSLASSAEPMVIATGGGVFAVPDILDRFAACSTTISLTAPFTTLSSRIGKGDQRPLWNADVEALFFSRAEAYARAHYVVDTDKRCVEEVVDELFNIMNRV
jgi:shikimate kinase